MKKTWKLALASVALVSGVAFTACSSDDEEILGGNETTVDPGASGEVKTQITFSIPHAKTQRSTADYVQQDGTTFNGMEKIYLLPFTNLSGDYVQASSTLAGNQQNLGNIANSGLTDGVETYSNVTLPYGDVAFLLYGESPSLAKKNQLTASYIAAPLAISSTPADITFSLTNIDEPAGLADFSTALRNLRADVQDVKAKAEAATATNDAVYQVVNNLVAGGASSVAEAQMSYLLNALSTAANSPSSATPSSPYETAINNLIAEIITAQAAVTTFYGNYGDMPVAVYRFDWSASGASDAATMDEDIIATGSQLSYPTSLYYMSSAFPIDYTSGSVAGTNWGSDGLWTSGARATISAATTKIALNKTVNYAVGRLDVKVKASAEVLKANDVTGASDTDVNVANEGAPAFTLTGVVVGGQPAQVGWDFTNTGTDWKNMVYDNDVVDAAANIAYATDFSSVAVSSYVLGLPTQVVTTASQAVVNIALEITNNGPAFYGKAVNGQPAIIPSGATFYLVGQLDPYTTGGSAPNQVFASDYYTTANLNITSLKNAYATLPDLTTAQLEFSLKVDLTWQQGIVIDEDIE